MLEYAGYGRSRNTLDTKKNELATWGYLRIIRSGFRDPSPNYVLLATGGGFASKRVGDLHRSGFSHVPRALLTNMDKGVNHVAAYLAIAAVFDKDTWAADTETWPEVTLSTEDLRHLMGGVDRRVAWLARDQLAELGFISFVKGGGANATRYRLLPTPEVNDVLQAHAAEDLTRTTSAKKVFGILGGRPSSHKPPYPSDVPGSHKPPYPSDVPGSHKPPYPSDVPGSKPSDQVHSKDHTWYISDAPPSTSRVQAPDTPEVQAPSALEARLNKEGELKRIQSCWCAQAHTPPIAESEWLILKKAMGKRLASLAVIETQHRMYHANAQIHNPYSYARRIAACYADKMNHRNHCDQEIHGDRALANHSSGRTEARVAAEKDLRAAAPNPLGDLTARLADKLAFPAPQDPEVRRLTALEAFDGETER